MRVQLARIPRVRAACVPAGLPRGGSGCERPDRLARDRQVVIARSSLESLVSTWYRLSRTSGEGTNLPQRRVDFLR